MTGLYYPYTYGCLLVTPATVFITDAIGRITHRRSHLLRVKSTDILLKLWYVLRPPFHPRPFIHIALILFSFFSFWTKVFVVRILGRKLRIL